MTGYVTTNSEGQASYYRDPKRSLWLFSISAPLQPLFGIALHATTGSEAWLALPLVVSFLVLPLLDALIGEDERNPPEEALQQLESDRYYRWLTYVAVPLHVAVLLISVWWAVSASLSIAGFLVLALAAGTASGLSINTGHELGHKSTKHERLLAQIALAVPAYGHFTAEHNAGHHSNVATYADPASARMGESIYRFAAREIPGAWKGAWQIETDRLKRCGQPAFSPQNRILQSLAFTALLQGGLVVALGWIALPFLLIHNAVAWWQLTSANYVEHYGLLRVADENGRPERCRPHHSWNSNYLPSNLVLFHLQRHSDHHTHPQRRYQLLRHYDDLPTLPSGYPGCYLLAWLPPLWFRFMHPRLLALTHVAGDVNKLNLDPRFRRSLDVATSQ